MPFIKDLYRENRKITKNRSFCQFYPKYPKKCKKRPSLSFRKYLDKYLKKKNVMKKLVFDVIMTSKSAKNGRFLLFLVFLFCFKGFYFSIKFVILKNHIALTKENFTSYLIEVFIYLKNDFHSQLCHIC